MVRHYLKTAAIVFLLSLSSFVHGQLQVCIDPVLVNENSSRDQNGVYLASYKWTPGTSIKVKFLGGEESVRSQIQTVVREWEQHANIRFVFVESGMADIRISFIPSKGGYSKLGTMALSVPQNQETMNLGWFNSSTPADEIRRTTLHEFGHALGLLHEHQSPVSPIKWNYPRAYAYYSQVLGWSRDAIENNIFQRYSVAQTNNEFDPSSIMIYPIPQELTLDGFSVAMNYDLSQRDKVLIGEMYPFINRHQSERDPVVPISDNNRVRSYISNIIVDHNVFHNTRKGMLVHTNFNITNSRNKQGKLVVKFFDNNGSPMNSRSLSNDFSTNGKVTTSIGFNPGFDFTVYEKVTLFLPYEELNVPIGESRLTFSVHILDEDQRELTQSGKFFFTYQNSPVVDYKSLGFEFRDDQQVLNIKPSFIIKYAQDLANSISIHFINDDGSPVKANASSLNRDMNGDLVIRATIRPCCDITYYNFNPESEYFISVPYSELPLRAGNNQFRFYIKIRNPNDVIILDGLNTQVQFNMTVQ